MNSICRKPNKNTRLRRLEEEGKLSPPHPPPTQKLFIRLWGGPDLQGRYSGWRRELQEAGHQINRFRAGSRTENLQIYSYFGKQQTSTAGEREWKAKIIRKTQFTILIKKCKL
jgi:hypothetical protein